jgi:hypothetical protein
MTAYNLVCRRLLEVTGYAGHNGSWRCPAHDDQHPSLSVSTASDGKALVHCHAGCSETDIVAALKLKVADLFPSKPAGDGIVAIYDYVDETGALLFQVVRKPGKRFLCRRPDGAGGWVWKLGNTRRVLYRRPDVLEGIANGATVFVVEGEKDADRLAAAGYVATTNPQGAGKWRPDYNASLAGGDVVIVADRDDAGRAHARDVAAQLTGIAARVRVVEAVEGNDVSDHLGAGLDLDAMTVEYDSATAGSLNSDQPEPVVAPRDGWQIADLLDVLRSYLYLDAGHYHFLFALAVGVAARASNGEPLWGLIVGPASSGKTEAIRMLDDVADEHPDELTAPGLLSWTTGQQRRQVGILRRIPDPGLLTVADFSTVLATSDRGRRDQLFALLRRAYDGRVHRDLGNAPGPLTWQGRLTMLAACTPIIDSYSTHTDALGPRWLYCRGGEQTAATRQGTGRKALRAGDLDDRRAQVRTIASGLVGDAIDRYPTVELSAAAEDAVVDTAIVTCYGRAGVEREGYGRREISGMAIIEEPPRLVTQTAQLTRALVALGFDEDAAVSLACRCTLDSMPRARFGALSALSTRPQATGSEVARSASCHRHVARMALEELDAIGVAECIYDEDETTTDNMFAARPWALREDHDAMFRAVFARGTKSVD